jgi:hypothetical protein
MLLMNKGGKLFDVPEHIAEQYMATQWSGSREEIGDMLSTLRNPAPADFDAVDGCCNAYPNYCPNR